ncbi:hypothetical protein C7H09_03535 [Marinobacter fuscus]|uniref:Lipoprotein n=1 Tax=Marinobacter fuscus TaxID=2109942 RepID=A0A2T1KQB1_9GAMM|nr:lipoprotein [Marinobacter fuscus]PSF12294.1 hypothetical protein C7H09_03535 [Marinobacter fuscus]
MQFGAGCRLSIALPMAVLLMVSGCGQKGALYPQAEMAAKPGIQSSASDRERAEALRQAN